MSNHVASVTSVPPPSPVDPAPVAPPAPPADDRDDPSRLRLIIEATGRGRFIYKILDRVTGEVIRQLPREEVERLKADPTYRGGKVIDTSV